MIKNRWSFDDFSIGRLRDGGNSIETVAIRRPIGISTENWYQLAIEIVSVLNAQVKLGRRRAIESTIETRLTERFRHHQATGECLDRLQLEAVRIVNELYPDIEPEQVRVTFDGSSDCRPVVTIR